MSGWPGSESANFMDDDHIDQIFRDKIEAPLRERIAELEGELRGVIAEMKHISDEARIGRSWLRVEMLADNVHTVLRQKLKS